MGNSPYARLAYGYDLGGGDDAWKIQQVGEWGQPALTWFDEEGDDDFVTVAEKRLLAAVGFTETDWQVPGYFKREREAQARVGLKFERYVGDPASYVLAAKAIHIDWGCIPVNLAELAVEAIDSDWDAKLAAALKTLEITPTQERPSWLLCAYWG